MYSISHLRLLGSDLFGILPNLKATENQTEILKPSDRRRVKYAYLSILGNLITRNFVIHTNHLTP